MLINVVFRETNQQLDIRFGQTNQRIPIKFNNVQTVVERIAVDVENYEGSYVVTPKVEAQVIPTANKFLSNDMTVKSIPYYEVSNTSGGSTVFIGKEVING